MIRVDRTSVLTLAGMAAFGSLLATAAVAKSPNAPSTAEAALIAQGKKVYDANTCANCHAIAGKGGTGGPNLSKVGANPKHTVKWLEVHVQDPKSQTPGSTMPAFKDKIKGKDLTAIGTYLHSLK